VMVRIGSNVAEAGESFKSKSTPADVTVGDVCGWS
jgi:hypothetical protein